MKKPSKKTLERASYYQYVVDGKEKTLDEMTHGELLQALMNSIDAIEELHGHISDADIVMKRWADTGKP